jgi:hypothetical protein
MSVRMLLAQALKTAQCSVRQDAALALLGSLAEMVSIFRFYRYAALYLTEYFDETRPQFPF